MIATQVKNRITTSTTTHAVTASCAVTQIVISIQNPGTTWKFQLQDLSSPPFVLIPQVTLSANTTPTTWWSHFDDPIKMDGGIDIVTTSGTPGEVAVWISYFKQPS